MARGGPPPFFPQRSPTELQRRGRSRALHENRKHDDAVGQRDHRVALRPCRQRAPTRPRSSAAPPGRSAPSTTRGGLKAAAPATGRPTMTMRASRVTATARNVATSSREPERDEENLHPHEHEEHALRIWSRSSQNMSRRRRGCSTSPGAALVADDQAHHDHGERSGRGACSPACSRRSRPRASASLSIW